MSLLMCEEQRRYDLYRAGLNDVEIASRCGVRREVVMSWRAQRGLPPNSGPGGKKHNLPRVDALCWTCARYISCPWPKQRIPGMRTLARTVRTTMGRGQCVLEQLETVIECPAYVREEMGVG